MKISVTKWNWIAHEVSLRRSAEDRKYRVFTNLSQKSGKSRLDAEASQLCDRSADRGEASRSQLGAPVWEVDGKGLKEAFIGEDGVRRSTSGSWIFGCGNWQEALKD